MNFLSNYLHTIRLLIVATLCIGVAIFTIGDGELFDQIFYTVLAITLLFCRKNINVAMVVAIILVERLTDELIWLSWGWAESIPFRLALYTLAVFVCVKLKHDSRNKVLVPTTLLLVAATDLYWTVTSYESQKIIWYLICIILCMAVRWFLFTRYELVMKYFPGKEALSKSEEWIYEAYQWVIYVNVLMILEYIIRHLFQINLLVIYHAYSYLIQFVYAYVLWAILNENTQIILNKSIKA